MSFFVAIILKKASQQINIPKPIKEQLRQKHYVRVKVFVKNFCKAQS
jgi:hypothetical protein